jgi:Amt family ammonium transporter
MEKTSLDILWVAVCSFLVFVMQAGFLCVEAGSSRSKNFINVALKNVLDAGLALLVFWAVGFGLMFGVTQGGWIGTNEFVPGLDDNGVWKSTFFVFQAMFCSTAVTILSGAVAERVPITTYAVFAILIGGLIYPVAGHWAWNGLYLGEATGWLGRMGFVDFAGSTVVHAAGGWVALAVLLQVGARSGRFPKDGPPREIPGASIPMAVLGILLLWFGWFGFNAGSTLEFNNLVPRIIANTLLATSAGLVAGAALLYAGWGKLEPSGTMNGALAGAVAITACCHCVPAPYSVIIGAVGGVICILGMKLLDRLRIDDVVGAVPVHLGAGIWGTLCVALFGNPELIGTGLSLGRQLLVQVIGIVVIGFWAFAIGWIMCWVVGRFMRLRVTEEEEAIGLNVSEHGASTEVLEFLRVMEQQARTGNLALRVPEEPFTEIGLIAHRYNQVMDRLETSNARTEAIVRSSVAGIVTLSANGYLVTSINPAGLAMFRFTGAIDYLSKPLTQLLHFAFEAEPDTPWPLADQLPRLAADRNAVALVTRRPDGTHLPVELTVAAFTVADETTFTLTFSDLTEKIEASRQLRVGRDERVALFESMDESVVIADSRGMIREFNAAAAGFLGLAVDAIGAHVERLFPTAVRERVRYGVSRLCASRNDPALGEVITANFLSAGDREVPVELVFRRIEVLGNVSLLLLVRPRRSMRNPRFQSLPF